MAITSEQSNITRRSLENKYSNSYEILKSLAPLFHVITRMAITSLCINLLHHKKITQLKISTKYLTALRARTQVHPGANFVRRPDGSQINLKHVEEPENVRLDVGYVVERHIVDDDIVLFNRQPSLHKMSIMGHRVKSSYVRARSARISLFSFTYSEF